MSIDTQAHFDLVDAEYHRLVTTELPDGWLRACMDAGFPGLPAGMTLDEARRRVQAIVNTVLPLHEKELRERIAYEVRHGGPTPVV